MIFNVNEKYLILKLAMIVLILSLSQMNNVVSARTNLLTNERAVNKKDTLTNDDKFEKASSLFVEYYKLLKDNQVNSYQKKIILMHLNQLSKELMKYFEGKSESVLLNILLKNASKDVDEEPTGGKSYERQPFKWGK